MKKEVRLRNPAMNKCILVVLIMTYGFFGPCAGQAAQTGEKDILDILTLILNTDLDFKKYQAVLRRFNLGNYKQRLTTIIQNFRDIKYLNLNPREWKLKKATLLRRLQSS